MKIVVQNFKTGKVSVADAPRPAVPDNGILVKTQASLISAGTDRAVVGLAKKGTIGKALARPDLVRRVLRKVKNDGLWSAYKAVQNVIAEPKTLGTFRCGGFRSGSIPTLANSSWDASP